MYHVAVILTDAQRKILWVNEDFTSITGYTLDEAFGHTPGQILQGPATEPAAVERLRKGLATLKSFKDEITNYRKNGEVYLCKLVIHPIFNDLDELINFIAFEVDGNEVVHEEQIPLMRVNRKYQSSSLKEVEEIKLYDRIKYILESEELYLDPNLSLRQLAEALDTNTKYLSQVINHCSGQNFQSFINGYRIRVIKEYLAEEAHHSLTFFGIAQQCGFKNKSTFYKVFKDVTGMTPKQYTEVRSDERSVA